MKCACLPYHFMHLIMYANLLQVVMLITIPLLRSITKRVVMHHIVWEKAILLHRCSSSML